MNQTPELIFRKTSFVTSKHMKMFSFSENSISRKWNIFRKCFYTNQTQPKGAFVLGENDFRKSFSPKPACLAATENEIFQKFISC